MKKDRRYTVTKEFCGYAKARHVLRYLDKYVSNHANRKTALLARVELMQRDLEGISK